MPRNRTYRIEVSRIVDKFTLGSPWIEAQPRYLRTRTPIRNHLVDTAAQTMRRPSLSPFSVLSERLDYSGWSLVREEPSLA